MTLKTTALESLPPEPRILIIRSSAIGDIVMCVPMLQAIRAARPDARILWLVEDIYSGIVEGMDELDEAVPWPRRQWRWLARRGRLISLLRAVLDLRRRLREKPIHLALDAQGLLRSRLLCRLSGATHRIGFDSREPGRFLLTEVVAKGGDVAQISSEYRYLAVELGAEPPFPPPLLSFSADARAAAGAILEGREIGPDYIVLCPFTTRPQKHWIDDSWAELAGLLADDPGWPVVVVGGPGDRGRARAMGLTEACDLAGETSLPAAMSIVAGARLVIGVDTGMTHVGVASGRPTVALFGSTRPYTVTGRSQVRVLYEDLACAPCRRHPSCEGRFDCMRALTPAAVAASARAVVTE